MSKKVWLVVEKHLIPLNSINPYDCLPVVDNHIDYNVVGIFSSKKKIAKHYRTKKCKLSEYLSKIGAELYHVKLNKILNEAWQYHE